MCNGRKKDITMEETQRPCKRVVDSQTEQTYLMRPNYLNCYGNLFGGQLMGWIDEIASIVAMRHCEADITTAAIDNLNFKEGATVNDVVVLRGKITYVGRTSMEVRVDTYVESRHGIRKVINRAYVVMVAVDEHHHPIPVPGLIVESENDRAEWEGGEKRYRLRKQRRKEGFSLPKRSVCNVMIFADPLFCFYFIFFTAVDSISLIRFSWFTSEAPGS